MSAKSMTANEVIAKLQALITAGEIDGDAPVITEGCDCWGDVGEIKPYVDSDKNKNAFMGRSDN